MDERALAKSNPKEDIQTHTDKLLKNFDLLRNLYPDRLSDRDWELLRWACVYHDLGKLNSKFQERIKTGKRFPNEVPHGLLSLAFIDYNSLKKVYDRNDLKLLFQAVAYHHDRKMPFQNSDIEEEFPGLRAPSELFEYDKLPKKIFIAEYIDQRYFSINERFYEEQGDLFFRFIMLEGLLNRLDYAASAHIPIENRNDFLKAAMDGLMGRWIKSDKKARWNELQDYMQNSADKNVIVIAQTGMGKTEAGLLWLGNDKGFFTLPLKSAINAIYNRITTDIVLEDKEERVGMLHSDTFIRYLEQSELGDKEEQNDKKEDLSLDIYYTKTRQLSLPLTICTLDQLFSFVFRYRGFEQKLATLSYAKVIIDEVQMYSPELMAYLALGLNYITSMGGKFAILTATLPTFFIDLLRGQKIQFETPRVFTDHRLRHSLKVLNKDINTEDIVSFSRQYGGKKLLVICNTVKSAVNLYHQLKEEIGDEKQSVHLLHSCFTQADRAHKEKHILKMGQRESTESGIWISTQIVEASLDIDFDLLFTELSDLNGLFQRMGRCYRKRKLDLPYNCFVFTGGDKRCSGVGVFIDKEIHRLSKEALSCVDGVIGEERKVAMVEELYTKKNLPEYYVAMTDLIRYVQSYQAYELNKKEASERFRYIDTVSVIPREVFEEHKEDINAAINELKKVYSGVDKSQVKTLKAKARSRISAQTVTISSYLARNIEIMPQIINDYEKILIAECGYNSEEGIIRPVLKPKAELEDFSAHSF
ncbi:CRISPR-associated helicase Cas3' [Desulfosporosinus nitroreducens]|uniref:CRISPR-associated helicase Cas3' n=1 Tax=Desulfosporosinus nitroreducens TaxID=2018668 RepID=UPI00207C1AC4|nr:CRISPR-associated helicase Cas3' [Desulfosporosinus nitroreducens]MCO1601605.1 CRISPR-associated helicase Cas3' [Desulfosporosinus nitroreducens]